MPVPELDIAGLLKEHFGKLPGRLRLPGTPVPYTEETSVEEVTPLQAMTWIANCWEHYSNGRNFYPTKLDKIIRYAKAMEAGEWVFKEDSDPITLTDGMITGGRHRLHAILLSHRPIVAKVKRKTTIKE